MRSISWKLTIGCCAYQGKGSFNGKRGERRYHSFDSVKYKHYEGSLLKINFWSKVYSKSLLKGLHDVTCPNSPEVVQDCPT